MIFLQYQLPFSDLDEIFEHVDNLVKQFVVGSIEIHHSLHGQQTLLSVVEDCLVVYSESNMYFIYIVIQ
jgi:hypothetical protein